MFSDKKNIKGIYIHVPFCAVKCPYCDFYSGRYAKETAKKFIDAVCRNAEYFRNRNFMVDSIYFGGGTPSLLSPYEISCVINKCRDVFKVTDDCETTVECNPLTMKYDRMKGYYDAGVNRISVGVQSFDDTELKILGRRHTPEKAIEAIMTANAAGFKNISCDLMTAFPNEKMQTLENNIKKLSCLPIKHVSSYMLKIEEGTPFSKDENFISSMPDDDTAADIYLKTVELLEKYGFKQYEISNFSKEGFQSRHNNKYWQCLEYIGIGPAAHSFIDGVRYMSEYDIDSFIKNEYQKNIITDENAGSKEEKLMLQLRLTLGISLEEYKFRDIERIKRLEKSSLIKIDEHRLHLTADGFLVSNSVICEICESL